MRASASAAAQIDKLYPHWEPHTVWTRFTCSARRFPQRQLFVFEEGDCTYAQAHALARQAARALLALGIRPGDHVALMLHNCPAFLILTFALAAVGAVKIPVNANVGLEELDYVLHHTGARLLFSEKQFPGALFHDLEGFWGTVLANCRALGPLSPGEQTWEGFLQGGASVPEGELDRVSQSCQDPYGLVDIMFTSGSTSHPKGVMLTHDMLLRSSYATCRCRNIEEGRRIFVPIPLFHLMAYNEALLPALYMGGTLILTNQRYDVAHCLEMMRLHRANDIVCVSSIMVDLLTKGSPRPEDFPHLRHAYWAAACPEWVWQAGRESFGLEDVCTGYGMTECGSTTTMLTVSDPPELARTCHGRLKNAGAAGCPEFGGNLLELKICGPDGRVLPPGERGEICCRGLTVTKGYYNNPEANARAFTQDGWFHTGDLGVLDQAGYLTFCGRDSDMYKVNGENVSPQFVDQVIGASPLVTAVEVVGIRDPKCGEVGVAFIDAPDASQQAQEAIRQYCETHLAKFQVPKYFIFSSSDQWPRTGSGKVKKAKLREIAAARLCGKPQ